MWFLQKTGLVAGLFFAFANSSANATTFGPIPVYKQAENTQYYVHARVLTNGRAAMESTLHRPYTYWDVQVGEQLQGRTLPAQLTVREPGGEVGDMGYHVAATADFTAGEEVFIALHDTDEGNVKEVVGLASGKYSVVPGKDGKPVVRSGLGLPVSGPGDAPLTPEEFGNLLHRIARGQATDADKTIFISRNTTHDDDIPSSPAPSSASSGAADRASEPVPVGAAAPAKPEVVTQTAPNGLRQSAAATEENSTGSSQWGWLVAVGAMVGLIIGLFFALR
jgi:hypothetical protein